MYDRAMRMDMEQDKRGYEELVDPVFEALYICQNPKCASLITRPMSDTGNPRCCGMRAYYLATLPRDEINKRAKKAHRNFILFKRQARKRAEERESAIAAEELRKLSLRSGLERVHKKSGTFPAKAERIIEAAVS